LPHTARVEASKTAPLTRGHCEGVQRQIFTGSPTDGARRVPRDVTKRVQPPMRSSSSKGRRHSSLPHVPSKGHASRSASILRFAPLPPRKKRMGDRTDFLSVYPAYRRPGVAEGRSLRLSMMLSPADWAGRGRCGDETPVRDCFPTLVDQSSATLVGLKIATGHRDLRWPRCVGSNVGGGTAIGGLSMPLACRRAHLPRRKPSNKIA